MSSRTRWRLVGLSVTLVAVWLTIRFFSSTALPGGNFVLWRGAKSGNAAAIRLLAARPQDVNEQDRDGWTPLLLAAGMGHTAAVQALLAKGADLNLQDNDGRTALMRATAMGFGDVVRLLLDAGAKVNLTDTEGNTALHHAAFGSTNPPRESGLWVRVGPSDSGLIEAPRGQYAQIAGALLAGGADPEGKNAALQTALTVALGRGNGPVALVLKRPRAKWGHARRDRGLD